MLETALVLTTFLILAAGTLDLGVGVFRYHVLAQVARHGARQAVVHGEMADVLGEWGPGSIDVPATANGIPIVQAIQPMMVSFDLDQTRVLVDWLDGTNEVGHRVQVTVTTPYTPILTFVLGGQRTLSATSTMRIAH